VWAIEEQRAGDGRRCREGRARRRSRAGRVLVGVELEEESARGVQRDGVGGYPYGVRCREGSMGEEDRRSRAKVLGGDAGRAVCERRGRNSSATVLVGVSGD